MHLAIQALSLASLQPSQTKEADISSKRNIVKNPSWQEADQLDLNLGLPRNKTH